MENMYSVQWNTFENKSRILAVAVKQRRECLRAHIYYSAIMEPKLKSVKLPCQNDE